jgi:hypothetical protein
MTTKSKKTESNLISEESKNNLSKMFGINPNDIVWYNAGICYSTIVVKTKKSALIVQKNVEHQTVNGGYLHGMELGHIEKSDNGRHYRVMC